MDFLSGKKDLFSVPFRLSRQFHFCLTLLWFCFPSILTVDRGSEQYLGTIFGVMLYGPLSSDVLSRQMSAVSVKLNLSIKAGLKNSSLRSWSHYFCVFYLMTLLLLFEKNDACFTRYQEHKNNQIFSVLAFWGYHRPRLFCFLSRFGASDTIYSFG